MAGTIRHDIYGTTRFQPENDQGEALWIYRTLMGPKKIWLDVEEMNELRELIIVGIYPWALLDPVLYSSRKRALRVARRAKPSHRIKGRLFPYGGFNCPRATAPPQAGAKQRLSLKEEPGETRLPQHWQPVILPNTTDGNLLLWSDKSGHVWLDSDEAAEGELKAIVFGNPDAAIRRARTHLNTLKDNSAH